MLLYMNKWNLCLWYVLQVVCQKCGMICVDQESYDVHMDDHLKNTKFRCHICPASFKRRQQYDDHLKVDYSVL